MGIAYLSGFTDQFPPCSIIQHRISSTRQTVTLAESFTGSGKDRAWIRRHKVDFEIGTNASTCGCRRKPVSGNVGTSDEMEGIAAA